MWPARSLLGLALTSWITGVPGLAFGAAAGAPGDAQGIPSVAAPDRTLAQGQFTAQGPAESITGTVVRATRIRGRTRAAGHPAQIRGTQFLFKAAKETVTVRAGPLRYRLRQGFEIHAGDDLEVKGWRLKTPGKAIIVAGEVKKGSSVLRLRDDRGRPLWLAEGTQGRHPGQLPTVTPGREAPKNGVTRSERPEDPR